MTVKAPAVSGQCALMTLSRLVAHRLATMPVDELVGRMGTKPPQLGEAFMDDDDFESQNRFKVAARTGVVPRMVASQYMQSDTVDEAMQKAAEARASEPTLTRDEFASAAMVAVMNASPWLTVEEVADLAYRQANAMIARRCRGGV